MADQVTYEIRQRLGVLSTNEKSGWKTEANIVVWNNGQEKLDIRAWDPDHVKMSKGITLTEEEARNLYDAMQRLFGR